MNVPRFELATGDSKADELLAKFDRVNNLWNIELAGDFWNTVEAARDDGLTGAGSRIAVIDSMPDTSLDPIANLTVHRLGDDEPHVHGTVVSLLIRLVAPDAVIEHYAVCRGSTPELELIATALERVFDDPPDYLCLSLGAVQPMERGLDTDLRGLVEKCDFIGATRHLLDHPRDPPFVKECQFETCLCDLIAKRMSSLRLKKGLATDCKPTIVSAAGNVDALFCPARAPESLSVGFNSERYWVEEGHAKRSWDLPSFEQSSLLDYSIIEPEGFVGSSFAAPLITGAMALRNEARPVRALLKPNEMVDMALLWEREVTKWTQDGQPVPLPVVRQLLTIYDMAWESIGDLGRSRLSPSERLEARLFYASTINNKGLILSNCREFEALVRAVEMWRWCVELQPAAAEPRANLASAFLSLGDKGENIGMSEKEKATKLLQARTIFLELHENDRNNKAWRAGLRDANTLIQMMLDNSSDDNFGEGN